MKNSIALVPQDLVVRIVKLAKDGEVDEVMAALELTREMPQGDFDLELVRRLIVISGLTPESLTGRDVIWLSELEKTKKALLGVWQATVKEEAMIAGWILLVVTGGIIRDEKVRLYGDSLAERITDPVLLDWLMELIENR